MGSGFAPILLIVLALVSANLPFVTVRVCLVWRLSGDKRLAVHALELIAYYWVVILVGFLLESQRGQRTSQGWEFYAVTAALFITFAFPGFVLRYLWKGR